jgi:DNA-binding IclR family transcriptional regulator
VTATRSGPGEVPASGPRPVQDRARATTGPGTDSAGTNRSVMRALSILELLSLSDGPMALGEVATRLKLPKSRALSLLRALVAGDFCVTDGKGLYALGIHSFEVGASYLRSMTPVRSVTPELEWLTEVLAMTSHFAVLQGDEVVYLAKHDPAALGLKLASSLGARVPAAVTAVGKAQLAYKDRGPDGRSTASPLGTGGPVWAPQDRTELGPELQSVRQQGYAVDEGQTAVGIRCVAAPLFDSGGCCGAIGVSYLIGTGPPVPHVAEAVVAAAGRASGRLGGRREAGEGTV